MHTRAAIQREERRQARRIHGGLLSLWLAQLGLKLARLPLPSRRLRLWLFRTVFGKKYPPGLNEDEAERPLWAYPSLNAVFTRGLKPESRPIPAGTPQFLSPCDGAVQEVGRVERVLEQAQRVPDDRQLGRLARCQPGVNDQLDRGGRP